MNKLQEKYELGDDKIPRSYVLLKIQYEELRKKYDMLYNVSKVLLLQFGCNIPTTLMGKNQICPIEMLFNEETKGLFCFETI